MQFGDPSTFAIECVHEPISNENRWVFGRMRLWLRGTEVGDFNEPACMLNVTAGHLETTLKALTELEEPPFASLSHADVFKLLDAALYGNDDRTPDQVVTDALRYRKFDFLTNGGESFDRTKSFIWVRAGEVHIQFMEEARGMISASFAIPEFVDAIAAFLNWVDTEGRKHAG